MLLNRRSYETAVSLLSAHDTLPTFCVGLVEIEEGELTGQRLDLQSQALARTSFAREPHVQQVVTLSAPLHFLLSPDFSTNDLPYSSTLKICRVFQLRGDGKLEQTVSMATDNQALMEHLHVTYRRSSWLDSVRLHGNTSAGEADAATCTRQLQKIKGGLWGCLGNTILSFMIKHDSAAFDHF